MKTFCLLLPIVMLGASPAVFSAEIAGVSPQVVSSDREFLKGISDKPADTPAPAQVTPSELPPPIAARKEPPTPRVTPKKKQPAPAPRTPVRIQDDFAPERNSEVAVIPESRPPVTRYEEEVYEPRDYERHERVERRDSDDDIFLPEEVIRHCKLHIGRFLRRVLPF